MKMKLRGKFLIPTIALIVLGMGVTVLVSSYYSTNEIRRITVEQLEGMADFADQSIGDWIGERERQVANLSKNGDFMKAVQDGFVGEVTRKRTNLDLAETIKDYPFYEGIHLINTRGEIVSSSSEESLGVVVTDRDYFKQGMTGKSCFSKVIISKITGHPVFVIEDPITDKDEIKGIIIGVVDLNQFSQQYIDEIKVGMTGYAYLYTDDGTVVAYPDKTKIGKLNMKELGFGSEMMAKGNGVMEYELDGVDKIVAFRKNAETGWTVVVCAGTKEIFSATRTIGYISLGLTLLVVIGVGLILMLLTQRLVTRPIGKAVQVADGIAAGDLTQRLKISTSDEIGDLARSLDIMVDSLRGKAEMAGAIADGDLTREAKLASDKDVLGQALKQMSFSLNQVIGQIDQAATQVSVGADQVSDSSHALSEGASKQAASMEEITSTMTELGSQTQTNAENASQAHKLAIFARTAAEDGNEHMQNMTSAMVEINDSSREIAKLNKTIDDIAFQTNLLALNAAVEAARAGKHGKGFAVVAQEVRHLAGRSAAAANQTEELIKQSVQKVENGADILKKTAEALGRVVEEIIKVADLIGEIASASNEQAQGISQINEGLSQVEQVTQQNTATAEETSSATEELSSQATKLGQLVARFRLNRQIAAAADTTAPKRVSAPRQLPQKPPVTEPEPDDDGEEWPQKSKKQLVRPQDVISLDDDDFGKY